MAMVPNEEVVRLEDQSEENGPPVGGIVLPKQNFVEFFNRNTAARRMRLDRQANHKMTETRRQCIICYQMKKRKETTVKCSSVASIWVPERSYCPVPTLQYSGVGKGTTHTGKTNNI